MPVLEGDSILLLGVKLTVGVFMKASIVVALAWLGTLIARRESASVRYAIWSASLFTLVILPFLSIAIPPLEIAQLERHASAAVTAAAQQGGQAGLPVSSEAVGADPPGTVPQEESGNVTRGLSTVALVLLVVWIAGILALLLKLVIHGARVRGIVSRAGLCDEEGIKDLAESISRDLNLRCRVRILISGEVFAPLSCGIFRPVILLPDRAGEWPEARKRNVLMHELGHVARWDYVIHIAAGLVCAVYWLNPLVWFAARRTALEREKACDDLAVSGTSSEQYAEELLHIARAQLKRTAPVHAVAMAAKDDIAERIKGVMTPGISRRPIPWTGVFLICAFTLSLTVPLAGVELIGIEARAAEALGIPNTSTLIEDLCEDDDPLSRRRAAWWLGEHETERAVSALTRCGLRDEDPSVRLVSAWALGEIKDEIAVRALIESLDDPDYYVREMAVLALGEIENPSAINELVKAFDREEELQRAVIWALGEIEGDRAWRARKAAFEVLDARPWKNEQVWTGTLDRDGAFGWLKRRGSGEYNREVAELVENLRDGSAEERSDAAYQIGRFGIADSIESTAVLDPLLDSLRDPVPEVRAMAVWALDEFNPSRSCHFGQGRDSDYHYNHPDREHDRDRDDH